MTPPLTPSSFLPHSSLAGQLSAPTQLSLEITELEGELESWQLSVLFDVATDLIAGLSTAPKVQLLLPKRTNPMVEIHPDVSCVALNLEEARENLR
jgi:hypothetical protein